jgi:hypothetical protein
VRDVDSHTHRIARLTLRLLRVGLSAFPQTTLGYDPKYHVKKGEAPPKLYFSMALRDAIKSSCIHGGESVSALEYEDICTDADFKESLKEMRAAAEAAEAEEEQHAASSDRDATDDNEEEVGDDEPEVTATKPVYKPSIIGLSESSNESSPHDDEWTPPGAAEGEHAAAATTVDRETRSITATGTTQKAKSPKK